MGAVKTKQQITVTGPGVERVYPLGSIGIALSGATQHALAAQWAQRGKPAAEREEVTFYVRDPNGDVVGRSTYGATDGVVRTYLVREGK